MKTIWPNNYRAAVSLTYDDAIPAHIDHVAPIHERNQSRATFYTNIGDSFMRRQDDWKRVASRGHELGNHSLFHPCRKSESMDWLDDCFDLKLYDSTRFQRELEVANFILQLTDQKTRRSYGNNCCNTTIGAGANETSMAPVLENLFGAARGTLSNQIVVPAEGFNIYQLGHYSGDGRTFDDLKALIEQAMELGGWIIFMFHGVGKGTHGLFIDQAEHDELIDWIGKNSEAIWSRPLIEVAEHLRAKNLSPAPKA